MPQQLECNPVSKTTSGGGLACFLIRSQSLNAIYAACSHKKVSVCELRTAGDSLSTVWQLKSSNLLT